jgi:hypothetical protein
MISIKMGKMSGLVYIVPVIFMIILLTPAQQWTRLIINI